MIQTEHDVSEKNSYWYFFFSYIVLFFLFSSVVTSLGAWVSVFILLMDTNILCFTDWFIFKGHYVGLLKRCLTEIKINIVTKYSQALKVVSKTMEKLNSISK